MSGEELLDYDGGGLKLYKTKMLLVTAFRIAKHKEHSNVSVNY